MMLKNVRPHSVDVGGMMLPSGQSADLDATSFVVSEAVASGHLVAIQPAPTRTSSTTPKES